MRGLTVALAACSTLLSSCAVGPNFTAPAPPTQHDYTLAAQPLPEPGGGEPAQRLVEGRAMPGDWWRVFGSPMLDAVVRQALADSPSLGAARAVLAQAQQAVAVARGVYYPQLDLAAAAERQKGPPFALGLLPSTGRAGLPVFNLYSLGPTVTFSPDAFGLTARRVEQQAALAQLQGYQLAASHLAISGNVVVQAVTIASLRRQIDAIQQMVADDEKNLALIGEKFASGRIPRNEVLIAETQLANDRTLLPALDRQRGAAEDALAVLVGRFPAEWRAPAFDLADFSLPRELPLSLPSALVRQRPDILAAQAQLHASSAAVGVATAQMYPQFPLSASIDTAALATTSLFEQASLVWTLAGGLTAPLFHGGALRAQQREAIEGFRASLAIYRETVLQAFGQVADLLRGLADDAQLVDAERHALDAAEAALALQRASYAAGRSDALHLVDSERSAQQARLAHVRAQAQRYLDSAQLIVAMGGGWWEDATLCSDCRAGLSVADERSAPAAGRK